MADPSVVTVPSKYNKYRLESSVEIRRIGRFFLDVGLSGLSLFLAMHLRAGWPGVLEDRYALSVKLLIFSGVSAAVYLVTGLSFRSWRFVSMLDMFVMLRDIITAVVIFIVLNFLITRLISIPLSVPISVPIIACFIMITTLGGVRVLYRSFVDGGLPFGFKNFLHADLRRAEPRRLLAYGANTETDAILRSLQSETAHSYQVVGIIDDDPASRDRCIRGIKVLGCSADLGRIAESFAQSSIKLAESHPAGEQSVAPEAS